MDKQQIENAYKSQWKHVEIMYQGMVKRAMWARDTAGLAWAKEWRLVRLRSVCQEKRERLERLEKCQ